MSEDNSKRKFSKIPTPFSIDQLKRLFRVIDNPKIAFVCFLALRTGMRINEVLGTKISEIEWELERINKPVTKGGKPRVYYIDKTVLKMLERWISLLGDTEYLFPSERHDRERMSCNGFYGYFKKYLQLSGLWIVDNNVQCMNGDNKHVFTFHTFRTTFCSILVNANTPIYTTKELMGHSKVSTTERHYAYLGDLNMKRELDKAFGRGKNRFVQERAKLEGENTDGQTEVSKVFNNSILPIGREPLQELQIKLVNGQIGVEEFREKANAILEVKKKVQL